MKRNPDVIASVFGLLWGLVPLSYWLVGSGNLSYLSIISFFMIIVTLFGIKKVPKIGIAFSFIILCMTLISFLTEANTSISLFPYLAIIVFLVNINILLSEVRLDSTYEFLSSFSRTTSLMAFIHITLVNFNLVGNHYGRSLFFGDTQPNLGGEIYTVAVIAGAISMHRLNFCLYLVPVLVSAYLLQSRTSLVVIFAILLVKLFIEKGSNINLRSLSFGGIFATMAFIFILVFEPIRRWILENVLHADDQFRGANSGFLSGRDARWQDAWNSFSDRPFFGNGMNWYIDGTSLGAHSPFLYSLVYFGIFGLIFWAFFLSRFFIIAKCNPHLAFLLFPCFLMFMLNDRFLNSNPFPLVLYFIVLRFSQFRSKSTLQLRKSNLYSNVTKAPPWHASQ